jgi:hypothetical protein
MLVLSEFSTVVTIITCHKTDADSLIPEKRFMQKQNTPNFRPGYFSRKRYAVSLDLLQLLQVNQERL